MKTQSSIWISVLCWLFVQHVYAQDTVAVYEPQIPILIERQDNVLFNVRVDAKQNKSLKEVKLCFDASVNLEEIAAVKLYYSGTEGAGRPGIYYSPNVDYIANRLPGNTLVANPSYSVLKSRIDSPQREFILQANQHLFPGINYFWISLQMRPNASVRSKVSASIVSVKLDEVYAPIQNVNKQQARYLGIGVRHSGDDGVESYRIPGLVTTNKGTLLGVYDARYNNSADLQEYVEIGLSRSTDGGQTWEKMRIPMSFGEYGGLPKAQNGCGDPAILVDKQTGTVWIVAAWTHGMGWNRAWTNSMPGMEKEQTAQLMMVKSEDDGRTWSAPINVTKQMKDPSWYFFFQGPGRGISMEDGTLVFASQYIGKNKIPNAGIMYSKDHGKTWKVSKHARTNTTESQVAEIAPGVLMLNMRDNRGGSRAVSITTDMGETWKEHESSRTALQESICMASLIHVKAEDNVLGKDILLFSNPNTTEGRHSMTIKASLDGGYTWLSDNQLLIDSGYSWGYSCLTMIDKETVGILYEGSVAHMTFQAIALKDIVRNLHNKDK
ncbi:MAG: sialidase [Bacteroides sp.]|nr:sialidase [Bacteroides sp.]